MVSATQERFEQVNEVLGTIAAVKNMNYAEIVRMDAFTHFVVSRKRDVFAGRAMTRMVDQLAKVYGVDRTTPEYQKNLTSVLNILGAKK